MSLLRCALLGGLLALTPALAFDPRVPLLGEAPSAEDVVAGFAALHAGDPQAQALEAASGLPARERIHAALLTLPDYAAAYADYAERGDNAEAWRALLDKCPAEAIYLQAHASYFLARSLVQRDELTPALTLLEKLRGPWRARCPWSDEATLFLAYAFARLPAEEGANASRARGLVRELTDAEGEYRDLPERIFEAAVWMQRELEGEGMGPLLELAKRMETIQRMLDRTRTGDPTQTRQRDVVATLDRLIELMREKEGGGGGGGGGQGGQPGQGGQAQGNQQSGGPAQGSTLPGGQGRIGELTELPRDATREDWGHMRDAEREQAEQYLREKFPKRYRELIEEYYRALSEQDR
ncbi:MAG: hypothetical protein R3F62_08725 [Planctomycetota bacterium]